MEKLRKTIAAGLLAISALGVQAKDTNAAEDLFHGVEMSVGKITEGIFPDSRFHRGTLIIPLSGDTTGDIGKPKTYLMVGRVRQSIARLDAQSRGLEKSIGVGVGVHVEF